MNIERTISVSPVLSAQRTSSNHATAVAKLANEQTEAQGAADIALIQAIPQIDNRVGSNIDVSV
jgi:hypothetical protein